MQDWRTVDRPARPPLRVVLQLPHNTRVARTILTIPTRRDMLRVAVDPLTDLDMALITAITVLTVRDIGVGLEGYLFRVEFRNSSVEGCGYNKRSTIFLSQASLRESM